MHNCIKCDNGDECLECEEGKYLNPIENTCSDHCPKSFYKNEIEVICEMCWEAMEGCLACESDSYCTECSMFYLDPATNTCVENCQSPTPLKNDKTYTCCACDTVLPYCSECEKVELVCTKC